MSLIKVLPTVIIMGLITQTGCLNDPPKATGTFVIQFTGDIENRYEGKAYFTLTPSNTNGLITIRMDISSSSFIRLTFFNPDPGQIFLEPGTYVIVDRLTQDIENEVLFDYIDNSGSYNATSGEVRVGIVKNSQIKGEIISAVLSDLNSQCSGDFDAVFQ